MRDRRPEHGQHGVVPQLGHRATVMGEDRASRFVVPVQHGAERLGVDAGALVGAGHTGEDARREAPRVDGQGRTRPVVAGRRDRPGHLVAKDRGLQRTQPRRRLDAQPARERVVRLAIDVECVRLTLGPIERQHLLAPQPLAQGMLLHERLQLADELPVASAGQVGVEAIAEAGVPEVLEPRDLRLGEPLPGRRPPAPGRARARVPPGASPRPPAGRRLRAHADRVREGPRTAPRPTRPARAAGSIRCPPSAPHRRRALPSAATRRRGPPCARAAGRHPPRARRRRVRRRRSGRDPPGGGRGTRACGHAEPVRPASARRRPRSVRGS